MDRRSPEDHLALAKLRRLLAPTLLLAAIGLGEPIWYAGIARTPVSFTPYIGCLGPLIMLAVFRTFKGAAPQLSELPPDVNRRLDRTLAEEGLDGMRLQYGDRGAQEIFPRPMILGTNLMLSRRVLDEFSPEALMWSVRTDVLASFRFLRFGIPMFIGMLLLTIVLVAIGERVHAPSVFLALPATVGILSFVALGASGYLFQIAADRRITRTPADLAAAREALTIPYRAQQGRTRSEKWMFLSGELRGRARRLGIDLDEAAERGSSTLESSLGG